MAGKALKLNPILNKELRLGSRSIKIPMFVMGYDIVLSLIAVVSMFVIQANSRYDSNAFSQYLYIYQIIGWTQFAITLIIVPILTAGTISGERERQTLDIMLTTPKKPLSIVWGKMLSAISNYMIFIISSIPIMAIAFILGGLNWFALLGYIVMMIILALYVGAVGMFCSATFRRTIASVVMTFLISFALLAVPYILFFLIYGISEAIYDSIYYSYSYSSSITGSIPDLNLGILPMILLVNPVAAFFEYMMQTMNITSIHEILMDSMDFGTIMPIISYAWIPLNIIVSGGVTWFFIWAASKKLNPIKKQKKKKRPVTVVPPEMSATQQILPAGMQPQPMVQQVVQPGMVQGQPGVQPQPGMQPQPVIQPKQGVQPQQAVQPQPGMQPQQAVQPGMVQRQPVQPGMQPQPGVQPQPGIQPQQAVQPQPGMQPQPQQAVQPQQVIQSQQAVQPQQPVQNPEMNK